MAGHKAAFDLAILPIQFLTTAHTSTAQTARQHSPQPTRAVDGTVASDESSMSNTARQAVGTTADASSGSEGPASVAAAAAAVYEVVPAGQDSILSLTKELAHVKQKPLWQQRFFTQMLQQLQQSLASTSVAAVSDTVMTDQQPTDNQQHSLQDKATAAAAASSDAVMNEQQPTDKQQHSLHNHATEAATSDTVTSEQQQQRQSTCNRDLPNQQAHLLIALAHLVKGTPMHIVKTALPGLVGLLLQALDVLQQGRYSRDATLLLAVLHAVETVLQDAAGMLCCVSHRMHVLCAASGKGLSAKLWKCQAQQLVCKSILIIKYHETGLCCSTLSLRMLSYTKGQAVHHMAYTCTAVAS